MIPHYLQNGLFVEPHKAIILLQPRLSSKPSLETVSLKLTNCDPLLGTIFSTTSAVASLTSSVTSGVIWGSMPFASAIRSDLLLPRLFQGGGLLYPASIRDRY